MPLSRTFLESPSNIVPRISRGCFQHPPWSRLIQNKGKFIYCNGVGKGAKGWGPAAGVNFIYFKGVSGDWRALVGDEQGHEWGRDQVQDCWTCDLISHSILYTEIVVNLEVAYGRKNVRQNTGMAVQYNRFTNNCQLNHSNQKYNLYYYINTLGQSAICK